MLQCVVKSCENGTWSYDYSKDNIFDALNRPDLKEAYHALKKPNKTFEKLDKLE